jgi:transposase InsO family protein
MIRELLHRLDTMKQETRQPWRALCGPVPYSSLMRWRRRQNRGQPVWLCPGPKKSEAPDWSEVYALLRELEPGRVRTPGTGRFYGQVSHCLSRRQVGALVQEQRQDHLLAMKRIDWLWSGLAWSCDATEYGEHGALIIPVQDLASRYRLGPLVTDRLDGVQIAAHLESLFRKHGVPLFLKRDNGSPFNHHRVDEVLARHLVLPLNNPPHYPRYNGSMEKGIRDFKTALDKQRQRIATVPADFALTVELTAHELNHQPRRALKGRTACAVFHDDAQRLRWTRRQRQTTFRLLLQEFGQMIGSMPENSHHSPATLWRVTVENWLRRQALINVRPNQKENVSTSFPQIWSHN